MLEYGHETHHIPFLGTSCLKIAIFPWKKERPSGIGCRLTNSLSSPVRRKIPSTSTRTSPVNLYIVCADHFADPGPVVGSHGQIEFAIGGLVYHAPNAV
jgi:hypothetical protein